MAAKKKRSKIPTPPIVMAAGDGNLAQVKAELKNGADVNAVDRGGGTALHQAVVSQGLPIVEALLAAGADVSVADSSGRTALHYAAIYLQAGIAKRLLDAGASVDALDRNGNTPLLDAVFRVQEDPAIIRVLLAAGADKNRRNEHGVSPMTLERESSSSSKKKWLAE
jgi:ankyrin repeat protein